MLKCIDLGISQGRSYDLQKSCSMSPRIRARASSATGVCLSNDSRSRVTIRRRASSRLKAKNPSRDARHKKCEALCIRTPNGCTREDRAPHCGRDWMKFLLDTCVWVERTDRAYTPSAIAESGEMIDAAAKASPPTPNLRRHVLRSCESRRRHE